MAYAAELGDFNFDSWKAPGSPYTLDVAHIISETRPGIDGQNIWNVGKWGDPFEVETITLVDTYANAVTMKLAFDNAMALTGLALTQNAVAVGGYVFKVKNVTARATRIVHGHKATESTVYLARVDARWTLIAIPFSG